MADADKKTAADMEEHWIKRQADVHVTGRRKQRKYVYVQQQPRPTPSDRIFAEEWLYKLTSLDSR